MKTQSISLIFFLVVSVFSVNAQSDPAYRRNHFNAMVLNPAQTGANEKNQITVDAVRSWIGMTGAPKTFTAAGNFNLTDQLGVGFVAQGDEYGPVKTTRFTVSSAYHLKLNNQWLAAVGLSGLVSNVTVDLPSLNTTVQHDPHMQTMLNSGMQFKVGYGGLIYRKDFYLGFSQPIIGNVKFANVNMDQFVQSPSFVSYVGGIIKMGEIWQFRPNLLYRYVKSFPPYIDIAALFTYNKVFDFGVSYQLKGSVSALIGIELFDALYIGYAYSYPLTNLSRVTSQTHEVSLRTTFGKGKEKFTFQNPRFFN